MGYEDEIRGGIWIKKKIFEGLDKILNQCVGIVFVGYQCDVFGFVF